MRVELTDEKRNELEKINAIINRNVHPSTDQQLYGKPEYWVEAEAAGDCEDYALRKRRELRSLGWPKEALDIAVCTVNGEGHAVLVARCNTPEGERDLVLDNLTDAIKEWNRTSYHWIQVSHNGNLRDWRAITRG